jgi:hypothetical protein
MTMIAMKTARFLSKYASRDPLELAGIVRRRVIATGCRCCHG